MNLFRRLSWSMRFALLISAVFAGTALIAGGIAYRHLSAELSDRLRQDVQLMAENLAYTLQNGGEADLLEQIGATAANVRDGSALAVFLDPAGNRLGGNFMPAVPFYGHRMLRADGDLALTGPATGALPTDYYAFGLQTPEGWIITARDADWVAENTEVLLQGALTGLAAALAVSVVLAVAIARRNEDRIARFGTVLASVGAGDHHLRIADAGQDDIGRLAGQVNGMLAQVEDGINAIRQVSTDVAHDLRAPLARLQLRLEPHAISAETPPALRADLGQALADLQGLSATFDAILRLSQMQAGLVPLQARPFDLVVLCRELAEMLEPVAEDAGHIFTTDLPTTAIVQGDRDLIAQAILNLADNAIRHCPPTARIMIKLTALATGASISISDTGRGIPEADLKRVKDRFVRLDASRFSQGTGLGLSLVSEILNLHGSELRLSDNRPGLRADFDLPGDLVI